MTDEWKLVEKKFQNHPHIQTVAYEVGAHPQKIKEYGISGFPTIMLVRSNGKRVTFAKKRTAENMILFATQA